MFHLLDGVPRPVSDALVAASISSAESATQCMNNVRVEIEKAFSEVPPSVKNAMAAAVSSVGATCEESLATIYFCFGNEFDRIKKEHELRLAKMESENRSLTLRVEQQANQLNILLTKHQAEIIRLYHQAHKFSQAKHWYTQNSNYGDQTTACTTCASPAAIFSSRLAKRPNEQLLPTCTAMVNQPVEANIDDRIHHETNEIHQTQSKRDEEHNHNQKPSSSMLQKTGQGSCQPVSPSSSQKTYHDAWSQHYDELIEYKKRFGNCNVPLTFSENPSLGIWVNNVSFLHGNVHIPKNIAKLDSFLALSMLYTRTATCVL